MNGKKANRDKEDNEAWVNRLYKDDIQKRTNKKKLVDDLYNPALTNPAYKQKKNNNDKIKNNTYVRINKKKKPKNEEKIFNNDDTDNLLVTLDNEQKQIKMRNMIFGKQKRKNASAKEELIIRE